MNTFKGNPSFLWLITILILFSTLPNGLMVTPTASWTWTWDLSSLRNASQPFLVWNHAVPDSSTNTGSTFQKNLNMALNNLSINVNSNGGNETQSRGFALSWYGQSPNMIYALLQCRGDASQQECYKCSEDAKADVLATISCNNSISCQVWLDKCNLRYDNSSFISQLSDRDDSVGRWNNHTGLSNYRKINPYLFGAAIGDLLGNLSSEAAKESDDITILANSTALIKGFAAGSTVYSNSNSSSSFTGDEFAIDAAVQCSRDLSASNCTKCLSTAIERLQSSIQGTAAESKAMLLSCFITFNSSFTEAAPPPSDSSFTETAPPPSDSSSTETPSPSPAPLPLLPQINKSSSLLKHQVPATITLLAVMIFMALLA
jgi:hypothetical protein